MTYEVHIADPHSKACPMTKMEDREIFEHCAGAVVPPVHPGRTLSGELRARGLTANALALKLRVPANRLSGIIGGQRAISPEMALRLGRYFMTKGNRVKAPASHPSLSRGQASRG